MSNSRHYFILHAAPFYLSLSTSGLFILSKRALYCQFYLHCELKQLILPDLKYMKRLAPRSWAFSAFSVCKCSRMNVCRVSLHKTCSCEISLICSYLQWFSVALPLLTALEFSCLLVMLLSSKPSPIDHLFFRSLYCYILPLSTCTSCVHSVYIYNMQIC